MDAEQQTIDHDVQRLGTFAAKLEPNRTADPIINDLFEAAVDWRNLGKGLLANEGYDVSGRVEQEVELFAALQAHYGARLEQNPDYAEVMAAGSRIIADGKAYKPPVDGYLGSYRIVRETFAFLQTEFGLMPGGNPDTRFDYGSPTVCVYLGFPDQCNSSCYLERPSGHGVERYYLDDLCFMGGKSVSLQLPPGQKIENEADVQAWFTAVAAILRDYGSDVLADRPGAWERLAQAAAERERLYIEECERLHAAGLTG